MTSIKAQDDLLILPEERKYKRRGVVSWVGGKASHLSWLLPLIPYSQVYIEPFGGSASVLLHRNVSKLEIYNDLDQNLINYMRVLQSPDKLKLLLHMLNFTLYSREELRKACEILDSENNDDVERAWAFIVKMEQIRSGLSMRDESAWSQTSGKYDELRGKHPKKWFNYKMQIMSMRERLKHVYIESCDAIKLIKKFDRADVVFYCDPPYVHSTRKDVALYRHDGDDSFHVELLNVLLASNAAIVLSGYDCEIYRDMLTTWDIFQKDVVCYAGSVAKDRKRSCRVEYVWRNARAMELCCGSLF